MSLKQTVIYIFVIINNNIHLFVGKTRENVWSLIKKIETYFKIIISFEYSSKWHLCEEVFDLQIWVSFLINSQKTQITKYFQ